MTVITPTATCRRKRNGFSWSTNSTTSFGQMMYQTGSGATPHRPVTVIW
ncbi:stationary phase nucleoid that sequesters iron and protects DNA from damage domain protein [Escherichia coli P0302308.13]|nr:stationary phase nucleoid that sequesters iron and protects DNA from damage domain protein [Escherichia coli P0302308.13]